VGSPPKTFSAAELSAAWWHWWSLYTRLLNPDKRHEAINCHIRAFEFFGGCPKTVLLDNLKAGVVKTDLYDPTTNRAYAELERHYGFVADPAKVRTPEHKGKVERSMPTVLQQLVAGRQLT